jgi:hypothetical protein
MKRDVVLSALAKSNSGATPSMKDLQWRLDRLERQLAKLTELVRYHAEDNDRLVRIVAEDRDVIRRELLRKHQATVRARKHLRAVSSKVGLES